MAAILLAFLTGASVGIVVAVATVKAWGHWLMLAYERLNLMPWPFLCRLGMHRRIYFTTTSPYNPPCVRCGAVEKGAE